MARFKRIARKVFCLPPLPTALIAVPAFALVIFSLSTQAGGPVAYVSYAASAYALVLVCTSLPRLGKRIKAFRERAVRRPAVQRLMNVPVLDRYFHDVRFKTKISLYRGLFINLLYIAIKLAAGVYYRSFWFISLAIYYALLALMRLLLLRRAKEKTGRAPMMEELHRYRLCGIMLLVMNQALTGIVVYLVHLDRSFHYPGYLIYAMALYSFYAIITAAVNVVRYPA